MRPPAPEKLLLFLILSLAVLLLCSLFLASVTQKEEPDGKIGRISATPRIPMKIKKQGEAPCFFIFISW